MRWSRLLVLMKSLLFSSAREVLGWPKRCQLAHAFQWEYNHQRLKLAQLLGQLSVFLTFEVVLSRLVGEDHLLGEGEPGQSIVT